MAEQLLQFVRFWFAPWGAAKGAVLEEELGLQMKVETFTKTCEAIAFNELTFTEKQMDAMKIVTD